MKGAKADLVIANPVVIDGQATGNGSIHHREAGAQSNQSGKYNDLRNSTEEELMRLIAAGLEETEQ